MLKGGLERCDVAMAETTKDVWLERVVQHQFSQEMQLVGDLMDSRLKLV